MKASVDDWLEFGLYYKKWESLYAIRNNKSGQDDLRIAAMRDWRVNQVTIFTLKHQIPIKTLTSFLQWRTIFSRDSDNA